MSTITKKYITKKYIPNKYIPKIIFIVPYRDRPEHKFFFSTYLSNIIKDLSYEIYFSHQCDSRAFNRGATKNIGFLAIKRKYPDHYKDITLVFNDIDTIPFNNVFDYETTHGVVKHFYGFKYALGGIVSFKGNDFETINGYPNFWGWGMEDTVLQKRCQSHQLHIDRSHFFPIGSPTILQLFDGVSRIINNKEPWRADHDCGVDGLNTIHQLLFTIDKTSKNNIDNENIVISNQIFIINISTFMTQHNFDKDNYYLYDLRESTNKITNPDKNPMDINKLSNNWTDIPDYINETQPNNPNNPNNPNIQSSQTKNNNTRIIKNTSVKMKLGGLF